MLGASFGDARDKARDLAPGDHASLTFDDPEVVAPFFARYLTEGLDRGQRVMAVVSDDVRRATEQLLAPDVRVLVEWTDNIEIYGDFDPDRVAAMYDALIGAEPRVMRILAVFDRACAASTTAEELERYEARAHDILNRHGAIGMCTFDTRGLDPRYLTTGARGHGLCVLDGAIRRNDLFEYQPV